MKALNSVGLRLWDPFKAEVPISTQFFRHLAEAEHEALEP